MRLIYDLIFSVFALVAIPKFLVRLKQATRGRTLIRERFGYLNEEKKNRFRGQQVLWLHAVSVGEVMASQPFIDLFLQEYPDWVIALSVTTPTGYSVASKMETDRLVPFYAPFDLSWVVSRVLKTVQPKLLLLMETEIWPNLILGCEKARVNAGIINGRISFRAFRRYRWVRPLLKRLFQGISFCLVQSARDEERYWGIGMPKEKIRQTGNMKFDRKNKPVDAGVSLRVNRLLSQGPFFLVGSTHWNEEEISVRVFERLRRDFTGLRMVLAPRHPEKIEKVARMLEAHGCEFRFFSDETAASFSQVLVIDQMGVLASLYQKADVLFIGGSLIRHGGQNPIEAAAERKPVIHGPYVFNFEETYEEMDKAGGAFLVRSEEELYEKSRRLLSSPEEITRSGEKAFQIVEGMQGAARRNLNNVATIIKTGRFL